MSTDGGGSPAGGGQGTGESGGTGGAGGGTEWTASLSAEHKTYVGEKGFKDVGAVLDSYRNFEKLQGVPQDRLLKLPENMDSPEGRAIFEKLGLPKEAKEYELNIPKEHGDEAFTEWLRKAAFDSGMTRAQAKKFGDAWSARAGEILKNNEAKSKETTTLAEANLKTKWGAAFDQNKAIVDQAAIALGLDNRQVKALGAILGPEQAMELMYKFGTATGEATFIQGKPAGGSVLTPESARSKIKELINDQSFHARLMAGDADAKRQWDAVNLAAAQ